jgi:hypothetical protein
MIQYTIVSAETSERPLDEIFLDRYMFQAISPPLRESIRQDLLSLERLDIQYGRMDFEREKAKVVLRLLLIQTENKVYP